MLNEPKRGMKKSIENIEHIAANERSFKEALAQQELLQDKPLSSKNSSRRNSGNNVVNLWVSVCENY